MRGEIGQPDYLQPPGFSLGFLHFCPLRMTALGFHGKPGVREARGAARTGVSTPWPTADPTHRLVLYDLQVKNDFCIFKWLNG